MYNATATRTQRILHQQIDHITDTKMLVEGCIPLQHTLLTCLDHGRPELPPADRALLDLVETLPAYGVMKMVILTVRPLVDNVEVVEADQTVDRIFLQLSAFFGAHPPGSAGYILRRYRKVIQPVLKLSIGSVVLLDDVGQPLSAASHPHTYYVLR